MILQLIWKEWREHWPKAAAIFIMYLSFMIACAFADHRHALELFLDALRIISFGAAIFMAMSTIIGEERARTRSTLASLPIDPRHVFYIKTVADILSLLAPLVIVQFLANAFLSRGPNAIIFPAMAPMTIASTSLYLWVAVLAIRQRTEVRVILVGITILLVDAIMVFPPGGSGPIPLLDQIFSTELMAIFRLIVLHSFRSLSFLTPLAAMKFGTFPLSDFSFWAELVITCEALVGVILVFVGGDRYQRLVSEGGAIKKPRRPSSSHSTQISTTSLSPVRAVNWKTWRDIRWYIIAFAAAVLIYPITCVHSTDPPRPLLVNFSPFEATVYWVQFQGLQFFAEFVTGTGFILAALVGVQIGVGDFEGRVPGFWQSRAIDVRRYFTWRYSRGLFAVLLCILLPLLLMVAANYFTSIAQWNISTREMYWSDAYDLRHIMAWRLTRSSDATTNALLYFLAEILLAYNIAVFLGALLRRPMYAMTLAVGTAAAIAIFTQDGGAFFTLHNFAAASLLGCICFNITVLLTAAAFATLARMAFTADWLARFQSWFESQRLITR